MLPKPSRVLPLGAAFAALTLAACDPSSAGSDAGPDVNGGRVTIHATSSAAGDGFVATCNWDGTCLDDQRQFEYDGAEVDIHIGFKSAIDADASLASLRANQLYPDVDIVAARLPPENPYVYCGQTVPVLRIDGYDNGRLRGQIDGNMRRCQVFDDILDDSGIDPVPFTVTFDLPFDPHQAPR